MNWLSLVLATLALWRVTHLLAAEDGPWRLLARLRAAIAPFSGGVFDCFYCLSLWLAVPFAWYLAAGLGEGILSWLALSGAASLLERLSEGPPAFYREDEEKDDGMLR